MRKALKKRRKKMRVPTRDKRKVPNQRIGKEQKKNIFVLKQLLEYHVFFGDDADNICIVDIVKQIPREMLFNFVGVLNNIYGDATLDKLDLFFSSKSINNRWIVFSRVMELRKENPQRTFLFSSDATCMEIMRYAFAYSPEDTKLAINEEQGEMLFFKLLLVINEQIVKYKPIENPTISKMCFVLSVINSVIRIESKQDIRDRMAYQMELAINFFKMLFSENKYKHLCKIFLSHHNISNWEDYILTIYGILAAGRFESGRINKDLNIDIDNLITKEVLSSVSLQYNTIINYNAIKKDDRESNSDYRVFRDKPIIKMKNGDFFIYNIEFTIDRLFNSLFFEFKSYNQPSESKVSITELFTDNFCERIIFDSYIDKCINKDLCIGVSEAECREKYAKKDYELGPPDYIVKEQESLLLFECKDIRISGEVIETHDYERIIQEYSNKIYKKPISKEKYKRIGITQLTGHMESIRKNRFNWYSVDKDIPIYPVLVLSDYKYIKTGFNVISNEWYQSSIKELGIVHDNNKSLIVLSFITLLKYHFLFKNKGFKHYFDLYINSVSQSQVDDIIGYNQTFDYFMSQYPYHLDSLENTVTEILQNKVRRNVLSINK